MQQCINHDLKHLIMDSDGAFSMHSSYAPIISADRAYHEQLSVAKFIKLIFELLLQPVMRYSCSMLQR